MYVETRCLFLPPPPAERRWACRRGKVGQRCAVFFVSTGGVPLHTWEVPLALLRTQEP
jgi:hypothetical protein